MKTLKWGVRVCSLVRNTLGVKGRVGVPGWGLRWVINESIIHINLHKPNNKLVNVWLKHFWCMDEPRVYIDTQNSPWSGLGGNHHLPPYSILYPWPLGLQSKCRPLIKVRYEAKLLPSLRNFQKYVARHLHASKLRWFATFCGWESNWQFDS